MSWQNTLIKNKEMRLEESRRELVHGIGYHQPSLISQVAYCVLRLNVATSEGHVVGGAEALLILSLGFSCLIL